MSAKFVDAVLTLVTSGSDPSEILSRVRRLCLSEQDAKPTPKTPKKGSAASG